ncbi:hypothetical protein LINGRAHAP2_LOCUS31154 [Linum grandiflorum]
MFLGPLRVIWGFVASQGLNCVVRWGSLELAWQLGIRNIALQLDSKCSTQLLRGTGNEDHQHYVTS